MEKMGIGKIVLAAVATSALFGASAPGMLSPFFSLVFLAPHLYFLSRGKPVSGTVAGIFIWAAAYGIADYWALNTLVSVYRTGFVVSAAAFVSALLVFYGLYNSIFSLALGFYFRHIEAVAKKRFAWRYLYAFLGTISVALLWSGIEHFRGMIFPMINITTVSSFFYRYPSLLPAVSLTGEHLCSGLVVLLNYSLFHALSGAAGLLKGRGFRLFLEPERLVPVIAGVAATLFIAATSLSADGPGPDDRPLLPEDAVMAVQANIPAEKKWKSRYYSEILDTYMRLTSERRRAGTSIVLWPETALNFYPQMPGALRDSLLDFTRDQGITLLAGGPEFQGTSPDFRYYNAVFMICRGRVLAVYRKERLIPFAEYCPVDALYPLFRRIIGETQFSSFNDNETVMVDDARIGMGICFESTFPDLMRERAADSHFIVVFSDDIWLGNTGGAIQHLATMVLRAVENRTWVISVVNSGISAVISPKGEIVKTLPYGTRGTMFFP